MKPSASFANHLFVSSLGRLALAVAVAAARAADPQAPAYPIKLDLKASLIRVGAPPIEVTPASLAAAQCVMNAIEKKDVQSAEEASRRYDALIPRENLGGDYTGLQWLCRDLAASARGQRPSYDQPAAIYRDFFVRNDYALLKEYLRRQYGLNHFKPSDPAEQKERRALLEDYIMFLNPAREQWESSDKCLKLVGLRKGQKVLDIGCGMGYYTYKMAAQVGPKGLVYAIDTEENYLRFIDQFIQKEGLRNIKTVASLPNDIKVHDQADVAFICSLYHVIYGWATEPSRKAFLESIKKALKPDARLVIVDNLAADGRELHSSYVDHRLVAAQLYFYGFRQELYAELSPLRYLLILKPAAPDEKPLLAPLPALEQQAQTNYELIRVTSGNSLVHIGSLDSYDITPGGIEAAKLVLDALDHKHQAAARAAIQRYEELIPNENFGGEFTALQWFCQHFVAPPQEQQNMLHDSLVRAYYHYLADDDYALLKDYLKAKYKLLKPGEQTRLGDEPPKPLPPENTAANANPETKPRALPDQESHPTARAKAISPQAEAADPNVGRIRRTFLEDFILFNNPKRPQWERTDRILSLLDLKKGERIADIGCGPGFFSFRFARLVGETGKVFALDIKQEHLDFMNEYMQREGIRNVTTVRSKEDDLCLKEPVDAAFLCSLYHIIYGVAPEPARQNFIHSLKQALKPQGRLIIVDNGPVEDPHLPYHGPYLAKDLAIAQLKQYGFELLSYHQIIPQRYLLVFRQDK
ncbi:MAG: methyltransferase domain-containing protein [Verrucomicrobiota bacterium]|jgi:ubiquinone/menaquinone biosynthesis C-methylase UbiE